MSTPFGQEIQAKVPVLLLKTKSCPSDSYEELFATRGGDGFDFEPLFAPVLQHSFEDQGMRKVEALLQGQRISRAGSSSYGGLVFTSQRAAEAFAKLVGDGLSKATRDLRAPGERH
jgi:uroporphyrinogen-III synthase